MTDYFVQSWQTDDGLPGNSVNDILQDDKGFIWLATIGGLVRFDGVTFKQFSAPLIARVAAHNIRALAQTADGSILMLSALGGVAEFKDGRFSLHPVGNGLIGRQLETLFVDPGGAIWVGNGAGQVRRWLAGQSTDFSPAQGLSSRARVQFAADDQGGVWIASGGFLGCYRAGRLTRFFENEVATESTTVASARSGGVWVCKSRTLLKMQDGHFQTISTNLPWSAEAGAVRAMFEDRDQVVWFGTSAHGLFSFMHGEFKRVEISQSQTTSIMEDAEGSIWVGTSGGGVNRLRPKLFQWYNAKSGLPEDVSDSVCADEAGDVWLANRGSGVVRITGENVVDQHLHIRTRKIRAYSVCADDRGMVWLSEGGLFRFPREHPDEIQAVSNSLTGPLLSVHVIYQSRSGDIWIGSDQNLIGCFRGGRLDDYFSPANFPGQRLRAIAEDTRGRLWVGTEDGQLVEFAEGKFTVFAQHEGLPEAAIRSLYADHDGDLWIGTIGGGLVLRRNDNFTIISKSNGLPDDNIAEIAEDNAGRLWCGARDGIFYTVKRELLNFADAKVANVTSSLFGKSEGLTGVSCLGTVQPMVCKTTDGRLWFATQQGVLALNSAGLKINPRPPPVFIDELRVNDHLLVIADGLVVPALCKKIEFRFSVLSYLAPQSVRIRYKLDGVDSDWVETVNQRTAIYSALSPGKFCLHFKACNNDGVWNESGVSLAFVVLPAWWQNWWFRGSLGVVLFIGLIGTVRLVATRKLQRSLERLEQKRAIERERARIARDIHDDLGAGLTQIMFESAMARRDPPNEVRNHLGQISDRAGELIQAMDEIVWAVNPQNDTLESLVIYLSKYAQDFLIGAGLRCRLDMPDLIPSLRMFPEVRHNVFLTIKEALHNTVKHAQAREVHLKLTFQPAEMTFVIVDDGAGFDLDDGGRSSKSGRTESGHGLGNMVRRMESIGGNLTIRSRRGQGAIIEMNIPLDQRITQKSE